MEQNGSTPNGTPIRDAPGIDFDIASSVTGALAVVFYVLTVGYPYSTYVTNGVRNGDFTLSTAFANCDKMKETLIIFNFVFFMTCVFAFRGALFNTDGRLAFPVTLWAFGTAMISIMWVVAKGKLRNAHVLLALFAITAGQSFAVIVWVMYKDLYEDDDRFQAMEVFTWASFAVFVLLVGSVVSVRNVTLTASLEVVHAVLILGAIATYVTLPPLPSASVLQLPLNTQEAVLFAKTAETS